MPGNWICPECDRLNPYNYRACVQCGHRPSKSERKENTVSDAAPETRRDEADSDLQEGES